MPVIPASALRQGKAISQKDRLGVLHAPETTASGKTVGLALMRMSGQEAMNAMFDFTVECVSVTPNIDFDKMLGRNVTVEIHTIAESDPPRYFDGLLTEARWLGVRDGAHGYALTLRPWFWLLGRRRNQRIFHNQSVVDIIKAIFDDYGFPFENKLYNSYSPLEYTVQYRETDLQFVCRLMERFGISYHFSHALGEHKLVMTDSNDAFQPVPGDKRDFRGVEGQHRSEHEHLREWVSERRMTTGRVALTDYNFETPTAAMKTEQSAGSGYAHGDIEAFDFPGGYPDQGAGKSIAKLRTEQEAAADGHHTANGDAISLCPGMTVTISGHPAPDIDGERFVVLAAQHSFEAEAYRTGGSGGAGDSYDGSFEFVHLDKPVVPERATPEARIQGPQTAKVVGEGEIDCDKYGRILVHFHWDRDEAHSMRCRVAQMWAGNNWGGIVIPRVGMEVVVDFLEGDPDQPLVVGCVYNADNPPPFDLPSEKNQAGLKSNSTPGGGGYNEVVFDDTKGEEQLRVHAQKNLDTVVLNDETRKIGNDRKTEIDNDESRKVKGDEKHEITGESKTEIGKDCALDVGMNRKTDVRIEDKLKVGTDLSIEAGMSIKLKVGANSIEIDQNSITIKAATIDIKASASLNTSAGAMAEHKAGGMMTIKGALVKIN